MNVNENLFTTKINSNCLLEICNYLETKDLIILSSSCKTLQACREIWKIISLRYHQPLNSNSEQLMKYLSMPIDITVYHLSTGLQKKSLSKNHYKIYPTTKLIDIQKAVQEISLKHKEDQEHCEIILPKRDPTPTYDVYKDKRKPPISLPKNIKRQAPDPIINDTFYSIPEFNNNSDYDISIFLKPIYEAITLAYKPQSPAMESGSQSPEMEIGFLGLFSLEGLNWKPLNSINFFQANAPLNIKIEIGSLIGRSILVITDISNTKNDQNTGIHLKNPEEVDDDRYANFTF